MEPINRIIHKHVEQRSKLWFDLRRKRMTASNANTISVGDAGLKTYIYKLMSYEYQITKDDDNYESKDMKRGNELEPQAGQIYSFETGNKIEKIGFVEYNKYVGCSPDLYAGKNGLCEIKCQNDNNFYRILMTDKVKDEYILQCHMQMLVCDKEWCDLFIYNPNFSKPFYIKRIEPDEEITKKLIYGFEAGEKLIKELEKKSEGMKL